MRTRPARRSYNSIGLTGYIPLPERSAIVYDSNLGSFFDDAISWIGTRLGIQDKPFMSTVFGKVTVGIGAAAAVYFGMPYVSSALSTAGSAAKSLLSTIGGTATGQWWITTASSLLRITKHPDGSVQTEDMGPPQGQTNPATQAVVNTVAKVVETAEQVAVAKIKEALGLQPQQTPAAQPLDSGAVNSTIPLMSIQDLPPTPVPLGIEPAPAASNNGGTAPMVIQTNGSDPGKVVKLPDAVNATLVNGRYEVSAAGINPLLALGLAGAAYALYKGRR